MLSINQIQKAVHITNDYFLIRHGTMYLTSFDLPPGELEDYYNLMGKNGISRFEADHVRNSLLAYGSCSEYWIDA